MKKINILNYRYEIIIFVVDAICMILELIASRLLSPYFGSSNIVWTSVIGIILLSSSLGNYIGGKIADRENKEKMREQIREKIRENKAIVMQAHSSRER